MLCSTFCHLPVSRRLEVELTARRFATHFHVGSPLGGLYHLSSSIFVIFYATPKNQQCKLTGRSLTHMGHKYGQKANLQVCESSRKKAKKSQTHRFTARRYGNLGHPIGRGGQSQAQHMTTNKTTWAHHVFWSFLYD